MEVVPEEDLDVPASNKLNIVPTPYKELDWNNGFRFSASAASFSKPFRAVSNPVNELLAKPRISIFGDVESITLTSVALACYLFTVTGPRVAKDCTINVIGTTTTGGKFVEALYYKATSDEGLMQQFSLPPSFTKLKDIEFQRAGTALEISTTRTAYDDIIYDLVKTC